MRQYIPAILAFVATALFPAALSAQNSTPIIGYYKVNAPAGVSYWTNTLVTKTEFQGQATSITGGVTTSTVNQTAAGWSAGAFNLHYIEILDGPWAGLAFDVIGNSTTSLTIQGNLGPSGYNLSSNVKYCVRKHATLGGIFKRGAGLGAYSDVITVVDDTGAAGKYYYSDDTEAGHIVALDGVTNRDNVIIYPGQGIILNLTGARTLVFGSGEVCYVKTTPTKVPLYRNVVSFVGRMNPVVSRNALGDGLGALEVARLNGQELGLIGSNLGSYSDVVTTFGRVGGIFAKTGTYFYDGDTGSLVTVLGEPVDSSKVLPNGVAFTIKPLGNDRFYTQPGVVVAP